MCKRTKHLSIQDDCWIFRIQAEDFTNLQGKGTNSGGLSWDPRRSYVYIFSVSYSSISGGQIHNFSWQNSEFGSQIIKHRYPQNRSKLKSELIPKIVCKNFGNWLSYFNFNVINSANIANRDIWWHFHQI